MEPQQKKKILYVITKSNWGGAQRYVFDLATRMQNSYEILVALGGDGELSKRLLELNVRVIKIENLGRDVKALNDAKVFWRLWGIIRAFKPNIIHVNSSKIGGLGSLAGRIYNLFLRLKNLFSKSKRPLSKIIFTAHGWAFNENRSPAQKLVIKFLHWLTIILSHETIAVSKAMMEDIEGWPMISKKITLIRNGLPRKIICAKKVAQDYLMDRDPVLKSLVQSYEKKRGNLLWIGSVSELHKNKGVNLMAEALSKIKERFASFVFVVLGEGEERANLEALIAQKGLQQNIFLLGHVPNAYMYLNAFHILTLTSNTEGLPYCLLEAGNAKLPVIATDVGGLPEIVEQMQSGILIRKGNAKDLKEALAFLIEHKEKRKEFGENLEKRIRGEFSMERMLGETKKVYEKGTPS